MRTLSAILLGLAFLCMPTTTWAQDDDLTPEQQLEKAKNYINGENGYEQDIELGTLFLLSAVEGGNAEAQYLLGLICFSVEDADQENFKNGFDLIKASAEQGYPDAMLLLAKCYEGGVGVDKDMNKAAYWMEKAKKAGADVESFNQQSAAVEDEGEYYTVQTTQSVNFREGPSTSYKIIRNLPKGTWLLIDKTQLENGFYHAYDSENGISGYVHHKYVKLIEKMEVDEDGALQVVGNINSPYAEITMNNDTNVKATIKIGRNSYVLKPHETKTISIDGGRYTVIASSPGVKSYIGKDTVEGGYAYEWTFYISHH